MKDIIRMNQLAGIITEGQAKKMMEILNEGIVSVPLSNLEWKLNPKIKKYTNVSSTEEALSFIESLTDEELNNLYTWRLGFNIPQSKDEKIKNLLDEFTRNQDTLFGKNNLNENENIKGFAQNPLGPNMQKQFDMIVSALKRAKTEEEVDKIYYKIVMLPKKVSKIFFDKLVDMGLAEYEGEGISLNFDN